VERNQCPSTVDAHVGHRALPLGGYVPKILWQDEVCVENVRAHESGFG